MLDSSRCLRSFSAKSAEGTLVSPVSPSLGRCSVKKAVEYYLQVLDPPASPAHIRREGWVLPQWVPSQG